MALAGDSDEKLRKLFHDISGELFLIRGYGELTLDEPNLSMPVRTNIEKMLERTDAIQRLMDEAQEPGE